MAFLKKVKEEWKPKEFPDVQIGEIIDFPGPYEILIRNGSAILVDKDGNEMELPGQTFECPVCFGKIEGLSLFTEHVSGHMPTPKEKTDVEEKIDISLTATEATAKKKEAYAKRLANLEKARVARAANRIKK